MIRRLKHLDFEPFEAFHFRLQGRDLVLQPVGVVCGHRGFLTIRAGNLAQIPFDAFINLLQPPLHLSLRKVPISIVHGLELTAVDGHESVGKQIEFLAQQDELTTN